MASSYSADLQLELMVTGEKSGLWGDITNENLTILQQAIAGFEAISIAGGAQTTALTFSNGLVSNGKNAVIKFTGTITGNQVVTIPDSIEKTYIIENGTTGAFTVEFKTVSGTGVTFGTADKSTKILYADGTNIVDTGVVSLTGVQTLTNKTLTSPTITSPTITDPIINEINDSNGNEEIIFSTTASAVNEITVKNAATTSAPEIAATGSDTNIDLKLTPKGTGKLVFDGIKFPNADGTSGQVLQTDGSGVLSFGTPSSGKVVQVVQNSSTIGNVSTTSTSMVDITNATATITPSNASNKILALWTSYGSNTLVPGINVNYSHRLVRAATQIATVALSAESVDGGLQAKGSMAFSVLDSPATTSAVTYKVQHRVSNASSTGDANGGFLTLMEIAV
jgi:hypothetical protein